MEYLTLPHALNLIDQKNKNFSAQEVDYVVQRFSRGEEPQAAQRAEDFLRAALAVLGIEKTEERGIPIDLFGKGFAQHFAKLQQGRLIHLPLPQAEALIRTGSPVIEDAYQRLIQLGIRLPVADNILKRLLGGFF